MLTNPGATIRMLITYAVCIPMAMVVGYLVTGPLDFGTLGIFGLITLLLVSPVFIKWHYPIMAFGLGCPAYIFFLKGNPPMWQVVVILSLGLAILERIMSSDRRFISVPSLTKPLLFTFAMAYFTAEMTGGIGLKTLGGDVGGGKKYLALFLGIGMYFALTSRPIPKAQRNLYIALLFLAGLPAFLSDLFPVLPSPLKAINLLFPPTSMSRGDDFKIGISRLGAFGTTASVVAYYMLAKFGLKGIFLGNRPGRAALFGIALALSMLGGFRTVVLGFAGTIGALFFIERLYRTRMILIFCMGAVVATTLLVPFANKIPLTFQRALSFLPFNWDSAATMDADGSKLWREEIWADTWPKVPDYLLLGKGYALSAADYAMMGSGQFANGIATSMDHSLNALAISGDYHSGPLSTLMPFGVWGAISYLWVGLAVIRVLYRNFKYGEAELQTLNNLLLVMAVYQFVTFFFIFGAYSDSVGQLAKLAGMSIAFNWGVCGPQPQPRVTARIKPLPQPWPA